MICSNCSSVNAPFVPMWITIVCGRYPACWYAWSTGVASQNCRLTLASTKMPGITRSSESTAPSITESPTARISFDNGLVGVVTVGPLDPVGPLVPLGPLTPLDPLAPLTPLTPLTPVAPLDPLDPLGPDPACWCAANLRSVSASTVCPLSPACFLASKPGMWGV